MSSKEISLIIRLGLLVALVTTAADANNLDRPRDLPSFYADASLMLANYLKLGESLGSPGADSRNRSVHYDWAVHQAPSSLRLELEQKVSRILELRSMESAEAAGRFYGHVAATWSTYGVSFGSTAADSPDFAFHARWAKGQASSRLETELHARVAALTVSYGADGVPPVDRRDRPIFFADASLLLTQFLRLGQSLGSAGADSRRWSDHYLWAQSQSAASLGTALDAKIARVIDLRSTSGDSADFYASLATTWSAYGVHFGSAAADSDDYSRHASWARGQTAERLSDELRMRVQKLLAAFSESAARLDRAWPCDFGDPACNRCVNNPQDIFREGVFGYRRTITGGVEEGPTGRLRLDLREGTPLPPSGTKVTGAAGYKSHVQSVVRLPARGTGSWLVMGRARRSSGAPLYVFEIGGPPPTHGGHRFVRFDPANPKYYDAYRTNHSGRDRARAYVEIPTTKHIGGMQAVGDVLAIPVTCDDSCTGPSVMFWDFRNPVDPQLVTLLDLPSPDAAHWVSFTRIESGQYLLIVNRGNDGTTDMFLSRTSRPIHASTTWRHLRRFNIATSNWDTGNGTYQNANFISRCGSNHLYLVAMRQLGTFGLREWFDDNQVELFEVRVPSAPGHDPIQLSYISGATFERFGDYCQMRGGSSIYVEPDGSPVIYCAAGQSDSGALKVSEITAH